MPAWITFLHPPRDDFAATMTAEEEAVWDVHFERLQRLLADGILVLAGRRWDGSIPESRSSRHRTRLPRAGSSTRTP
jgi:hypothetical protein